MFFCLVLLCFQSRLFVDALWSPAEKGLTPWLSFVMCNCGVVRCPGTGVVPDCIDSRSLPSFLFCNEIHAFFNSEQPKG